MSSAWLPRPGPPGRAVRQDKAEVVVARVSPVVAEVAAQEGAAVPEVVAAAAAVPAFRSLALPRISLFRDSTLVSAIAGNGGIGVAGQPGSRTLGERRRPEPTVVARAVVAGPAVPAEPVAVAPAV